MPEDNTKNMELWDAVKETPPKYTKKVEYGTRKFTNINSQYQIGQATGQWGLYGTAWGMKDLNWGMIKNAAGEPIEVTLDAIFWYPGGEFPISSDETYRSGNDTRKKLLTDATTKALSKLGFSADVFLGCYDDNKYVRALLDKEQAENAPPPQQPQQPAPTAGQDPDIDIGNALRKLVAAHGRHPCAAAAQEVFGENRQPKTLDELLKLTEKIQEMKK